MGLYNFKPQFVAAILSHAKRHTIRAKRKIAPRVGEICHCYTGLRQKGAKLLGRWPCVRVQDIRIGGGPSKLPWRALEDPPIWIDGIFLKADEREALAISDGFKSFAEMMEFWEGRLPFHGDIIHWNPEASKPESKKARKERAK